MIARLIKRLFATTTGQRLKRARRPYRVVCVGSGTPYTITAHATVPDANRALVQTIYVYQEHGWTVVLREKLSVRMSKYHPELDFFIEVTLTVEHVDCVHAFRSAMLHPYEHPQCYPFLIATPPPRKPMPVLAPVLTSTLN